MPIDRLALNKKEAAAALGLSFDFFAENVYPDLRVVRRGRRILVPVSELEAWLSKNAARVLEGAT
ncbi:MAG: excisionase [Actinomycetota bacterium]